MRDAPDDMKDTPDSQIPRRDALRSLSADEPATADAKPAAKQLSPAAWAEKLGHVRKANPNIPQSVTHAGWQHAAADKLHGWAAHAYHHSTEPFLLSQEDYEKALEAAGAYPTVAPHDAALPESQKARFEGFVPRAGKKEKV